jgi:hypothetical protein
MHEGGIGAVFQEPAHKIGEQRLMAADRRIDAAGLCKAKLEGRAIERLAHAVEALKFEALWCGAAARHGGDRCQRLRIMGRKLREDRFRRGQKFARASQVRKISMHLAGENRIVVLAFDLRSFDLAVPVSPFDQAQHDAPVGSPREVDDPVQHRGRAFLIGLHNETDAVPPAQPRIVAEGFEEIE